MKVLILSSQSGDWESLYIDGKLIDEGHTLGEGDSRLYMLKMAEKWGFTYDDIEEHEVTDEDENYLYKYGSFPQALQDLKGKYYA